MGIGDRAGVGLNSRDLGLLAFVVRADDRHHIVQCCHRVEQLGHRRLDLGLGHVLFRTKDDCPRLPSGSLKLALEDVETVAALRSRSGGVAEKSGPHLRQDPDQDDNSDDPASEDLIGVEG